MVNRIDPCVAWACLRPQTLDPRPQTLDPIPQTPDPGPYGRPRGITWAWLLTAPALIGLLGIGLGLLLVSLRKSRPPRGDAPIEAAEFRQDARGPGDSAFPALPEGVPPPSPSGPAVAPLPPPASNTRSPAANVPSSPGATAPTAVRPTLERLAGRWSGETEDDGVLTVQVTAKGRLAYAFSEGCREHGQGLIRVRDFTVFFFEDGETEPVAWRAHLDGAGRLNLQMEDHEEVYVLARQP